jgi:hypothetical protein
LTGEAYRFITLTVPNPNLPLLKTRAILDRCFTLFRKRDYFIRHIRGASKSEEFTITPNGYHYHFHFLAVTRFISWEAFRREWTDIVERVFEENQIPFSVATADGMLMVRIDKVTGSVNGLKGAVQEVCKYITKSDSWEKIPEEDLIEVAAVERFPRMFELLGSFRTQRAANAILAFHHPIVTLLLIRAIVLMLRKLKEIIKRDGAHTILDTKCLSDGKVSDLDRFSGASPPGPSLKPARQLNWRRYIEQFGLDNYRLRLVGDIENAREYRKCALRMKYPFASFRTLDGQTF